MIMNLRELIGREEFDYPALMAALSGYANPRDRVTALLRRGDILRVKKGLYVFGDQLRRRPYSLELLANLIYGPSFVSLDSALSFHGLIPERVAATTSVTGKRPKKFDTPVGLFIYRQVPREYFPLGMDRVEEGDVAFLVAVPERALADKVRDDRGHPLRTRAEAARYLFEDLRLDREEFERMDPDFLDKLAAAARSRKIATCARLLRKLKGRS
jgi:predicted transcriptional regulator of viral defense system